MTGPTVSDAFLPARRNLTGRQKVWQNWPLALSCLNDNHPRPSDWPSLRSLGLSRRETTPTAGTILGWRFSRSSPPEFAGWQAGREFLARARTTHQGPPYLGWRLDPPAIARHDRRGHHRGSRLQHWLALRPGYSGRVRCLPLRANPAQLSPP